MLRALAFAVLLGAAGAAAAQKVTMSGSLGTSKALLLIDGTPRTVAVGERVDGVKLVSTGSDQSVVEIGGQRSTLRIGASVVGGGGSSEGTRIVLTAGPGGHFFASGSINGASTQFLVDTGATSVAIGQAEADRLGLKYKTGRRGHSQTANGIVPFHEVTLASVRIGDVTVYDVRGVVIASQMSHILLGNSFLTRFQMTRHNDVMTLERRF